MKTSTYQKIKFITLLLILPGLNFSQTNFPDTGISGTIQNQPYESCVTCSGATWINTGNLGLTDTLFCTTTLQPYMNCYHDQCYWSRYLDCENFGFEIPAAAIIRGIQLDVTGFCDKNGAVSDYEVSLLKSNVVTGSNMAMPGFWPSNGVLRSYGGSTLLWGSSWTASDINNTHFGVYFKVKNHSTQTPTLSFDGISVTVTYELATGIYTETSTSSPLTISSNSEELSVNFEMQKETAQLNLYDIQGKLCFSDDMKGNPGDVSQKKINTSELKSGIYLVNVYSDNKLYRAKVSLIK